MSEKSVTGGCYCGAIRYEAKGKPTSQVMCYCENCRRAIGAHSVAWVTYHVSHFHFTEGKPTRFRTDTDAWRTFCRRVVQEGEITRVGETHTRPIDTRVISATNKNLHTEVQEGRFRQDLFFRLNVIPIRLPGLRDRREDILDLAAHFLQRHCEHYNRPVPTLDAGARRCLVGYDWPGNVRELEHEMERAVTLMDPGADLTEDSLLVDARQRESTDGHRLGSGSLKEQMAGIEAGLLRQALERNNGNQTRTAEQLVITRQGLIKKLQRYGLVGGRGTR